MKGHLGIKLSGTPTMGGLVFFNDWFYLVCMGAVLVISILFY